MEEKAREHPGEPVKGARLGKIIRVLKITLLAAVLLSGVVAGLVFGGGLYAVADTVAPLLMNIPFVGDRAAQMLLGMDPPLGSVERRALEMDEKEKHIIEMIETLEKEKAELEKNRKALAESGQEVDMKLQAIRQEEEKKTSIEGEAPRFYGLLSESFEEMPAAKAANILTLLSISEAADLMGRLGADQRGAILAKMPPEAAARLLKYARQVQALPVNGGNGAGAVEGTDGR